MEGQTAGVKQALFGAFDFEAAAADRDFNEAQVRAAITDPLLKALGYTQETILRDKALQSPFLRTGSKKRKVNLIPDYVLKVGGSAAWVLDAKAPWQQIRDNGNIEQAYSYAAHPEIRSVYFALCNGLEFACWRTAAGDEQPALYFPMSGIDGHWQSLRRMLAPESFQPGKKVEYENPAGTAKVFDYAGRPLLKEIPLRRQAARRHFGVHPYFTKQSWNVVSKYIENYTKVGDTVLDPFGGSGITVIEALMLKRKAVNIDLNPFAVFLVDALAAPVNEFELRDAFERVKKEYIEHEPKTKKSVKEIIESYHGPKVIALPKGSDVETVPDLFSDEQTARLSLLKALIKKTNKQKDKGIYKTLMLMFSGIVHFYNNTSFDGPHGNTGASAMWMYRYRVAEKPTETDFLKLLDSRFKRILAAKKEMSVFINEGTIQNAQVVKGTAANLSFLEKESVDYIYTDPPYGKNIPYLDLSAMWLAWLDLDVSEQDYELEAIEGGSREKSKEEYKKLIAESIQEMYRVLKFDRWLSFVFAHKDPEFWHLIIETCEKSGFEYRGAVSQKNGSSNYHKRQHPFTVLSGQLIINFRKVKNPRTVLKANLGMDIGEIVIQTIEGVIAKNDGAFLEQINDELIIKGLELGFLDLLKKEYSDLTPLLLDRFDYDANSEKYTIKKHTRFQTHIDARLRIQYYLISYLRRMEWENKNPSFNDIVLAIMPLLRNGSTPANQTILSVLEDIGEKTGQGAWRLKSKGQKPLEF
ncbi:MAG: type I restriction enzyme HsdR N-terminal domain-containing protein [Treponema sp.]|nr:type I restriction enzyme HsdR N-terminal domain-containing protein [Treponema sp.]